MDRDAHYADLLAISALCVKRLHPAARITVLTDDESRQNVAGALRSLSRIEPNIRSVGRFDGSPRLRSRFVKTQCRNVIRGDFLYLDCDTVAVGDLGDLFRCGGPLGAAIDRNCVDPDGGFPAWVIPDFERLGWKHPTRFYLNGGVVFWKECPEARELGRLWHENWLKYTTTVDNPADQPAFNHSLSALNIEPKIIDDAFNARVGISAEFARGARLYHLLSGDERANGTFIDTLLAQYRAIGTFDASLVERVAANGDPWVGRGRAL